MAIEIEKTYNIADLKLASAVSLFIPIKSLSKAGTSKIYFVFENSNKLQSLISDYWNKSLQVTALDYANQIDSLKTQVYEELNR